MIPVMDPADLNLIKLLVGLSALAGVIWRVVTWHNSMTSAIEALRKEITAAREEITSNERDDEARDNALRAEFETRLNSEKELLETKLANHAREDSRMMEEITALRKTVDDVWKAVSSIEKQVAALNARNK